MWFNCTKTALEKLKVAYNNNLRLFMGLPWHNSATEMFVNLNIKSFGEMLWCFVYGLRSWIMISGNLMLIGIYKSPCIIHSKLWAWWRILLSVNVWLATYLYYLRTCIWYFPCRIFGSSLEIFCNDCSFCFIVLTCFIFIYVCSISFFYMDLESEINFKH